MYAGVIIVGARESDPGDGTLQSYIRFDRFARSIYKSLGRRCLICEFEKHSVVHYPIVYHSKLHLKTARVYINAENVYLWSKYTNYDPENTTYINFSGEANGNSSSGLNASGNAPNGAFMA
jgi:hypothetical protein